MTSLLNTGVLSNSFSTSVSYFGVLVSLYVHGMIRLGGLFVLLFSDLL